MLALRCTQADHEYENKLIEGICIDSTCKAAQRIWCVICQKKIHHNCNRNCLLVEAEVKSQLQKLQSQLFLTLESSSQLFSNFKKQLIQQLEQLEKILVNAENKGNIKVKIDQIDSILARPFSQQTWSQTYNLIYNQPSHEENRSLEKITITMNKIKLQIRELEQWLTNSKQSQEKQTQIIQSYARINNSFIVKAESPIFTMDCSPDSSKVVYSQGRVVRIYDLLKQQQVGNDLQGHENNIWSVKYSPSGEFIASGGIFHYQIDDSIRLWNSETKTLVGISKGHKDIITSLVFSPDSIYLVSGSFDKTIRIWNIFDGQVQRILIGHLDNVTSVDYSPNGNNILSGSDDMSVRIWDPKNGKCARQFKDHTASITQVKYSFDSQFIVSASLDKTICIWSLSDLSFIKNIFDDHKRTVFRTDSIYSLALSPNFNLILSGSSDNSVRLWSTQTESQFGVLHQHTDIVSSVVFSPSGHFIISASYDETLRITLL